MVKEKKPSPKKLPFSLRILAAATAARNFCHARQWTTDFIVAPTGVRARVSPLYPSFSSRKSRPGVGRTDRMRFPRPGHTRVRIYRE